MFLVTSLPVEARMACRSASERGLRPVVASANREAKYFEEERRGC